MERSFSDRVLAGVCGGIAETLRVNSWLIRVVFIALTVVSMGAGVLVYLALWWVMPQRMPSRRPNGGFVSFLLALALLIGMSGLWIGRDAVWLRAPDGQSLFIPLTLLCLGAAFLLRQVRMV
jgi:phage shock protein C